MYYWSLLLSTLSIKPANDLLTSIMISSNKFQCSASVYWLETIGILAYITLTRSLLHTLTPSTPTTYAVDVMKDFYCITESILLQKKMLFDVDLRHKCAELLIEIFRVVNPSLPSTSLSREKELSMAIEWCNSQGWSTISQAKRMRLSKGSRQETTPQPPLSADSPSSTTPSEQLVDSSGIESLSQTKKRPRGDGFFVPQTLDNEGTKKRRAVTRVKQLLNQIASMATSTPVSENIPVPPSPSPLTPPLPPQNPSSPRPPSTIRKIPIGKAKLVPPPYRVPDHIVQRNPGVLNKIPAPTVLRGGVKEKKRRAILKLRQIYYQERITGKIQLRSGDEEGEESGEVNERE